MKAKEFARHIFEQVKSNWCIPVTEHQVYSTAEQKIGVWTDGKPLYSKVIASATEIKVGDVALNWTTIMSAGVSNAVLVKCEAFNSIYSSTRNVPVSYRLNGGNLQYYSPSALAEYNINGFILYYTKTTDTATSPKVPYEPLHEWSTEEKLVGYWIDGKAVYEKTVSCGALPNVTMKSIAHGITNLDRVISMGGTALNPTGNTHLPLPFASNTESVVYLAVVGNNVQITTLNDRSGFTTSYVTLRYTKTT